MASRFLGLARDAVLASAFGAAAAMDAFLAAFRLPNTLRRFTAEGALTQAFVPSYQRARMQDAAAAAAFAGDLLFILAAFLLTLTAAAVLAAPFIIGLIAPGLAEPALAADLLRTVFPYIFFISLAALFAGMLNAAGRFRAAAAAPMLLSVCLIAAAGLSSFSSPPIAALGWGVLAGGVLQLMLLAVCVRRAGLQPSFRFRPPSSEIRGALKRMGQSSLGAGATQINLLINLIIASLLPAGSISWLYYADRLMELPAGLLGAALATVALPAMSGGSAKESNLILDNTLRLALLLALPAAIGLAMLATPIVEVLFMRGAFTADDAAMTAQATAAYSVGVVGLVALRPLAAAFFARQDAATPAKIAAAALLFTQACNVVLIYWLEWNHAGLALSVGLGATFNALSLWLLLRRRGWHAPAPGWRHLLGAMAAAAAAMALWLYWARPLAEFSAADGEAAHWSWRLAMLAAMVLSAAAVYFLALRMCGIRPRNFAAPQESSAKE